MSAIPHNLQVVRERIAAAAHSVLRDPQTVALLAVSKTFGPGAVIEAALAGQHAFGENYLQEALDKMDAVNPVFMAALPHQLLEWHFIGPIQSNKTRQIAARFDWVHSVEQEKTARRLSEQRPAHQAPLQICLQVNISGEASKSGVAIEAVPTLARAVAAMPRLQLRGLMAIPEPSDDTEQERKSFRQLRVLSEQLQAQGIPLDTLSMGMSADMQAAIAEGATIVRVGTAIFGSRKYAK